MAETEKPTAPKTGASSPGPGAVEHADASFGESTGAPASTQGGSRGAANAMGRHSKEADHSPGSPAELAKAKGTEKSA